EQQTQDFPPRNVRAHLNREDILALRAGAVFARDLSFDVGHHALGLCETAARHQPTRTFGQIAPYEQNRNRQDGAERERAPPTHIWAETAGLEQNDTQSGAPRSAD